MQHAMSFEKGECCLNNKVSPSMLFENTYVFNVYCRIFSKAISMSQISAGFSKQKQVI